jgi:hypothetical protein
LAPLENASFDQLTIKTTTPFRVSSLWAQRMTEQLSTASSDASGASTEVAAVIRAAVFAGHVLALTPVQNVRHKFGVRLLRVLCTGLSLTEACAQHAMVLWTISASSAGANSRGCDMDVCVACLMVCAKMHELSGGYGLRRFALACARVFESREQTKRALEWTLQQDAQAAVGCGMQSAKIRYLTCVLRLFESADLTREVAAVTQEHLKYAEIHVLFTAFAGQWYHHLIEIYEYLLAKTQGMSSEARMETILCVCGVHDLTQ